MGIAFQFAVPWYRSNGRRMGISSTSVRAQAHCWQFTMKQDGFGHQDHPPQSPNEGIFIPTYLQIQQILLLWFAILNFVICNDAGQSQPHGLKWDGRDWHCGIMRPRDLSSAGIRRICEYQQVHWSGNVEHIKIHMNQSCCFRHLVIFVDYAAWCWV